MNISFGDVRIIGEKSNGLRVFVNEATEDYVINECYSDVNQFNLK